MLTSPLNCAALESPRFSSETLAKLFVILAFIVGESFVALPAVASPSLVQHASKDAGTTLSSSLAFSSNNTSGNWIAVVIRAGHAGQTFIVNDTRGNTYQQAVLFNQTLDTPNGDTLGIFYAENITGGANTVTVAESISNNTLRFAILEYSGVATTGSLDVTATAAAQGSSSSANSGSGTTTAGGDLVLGAVLTGSGVTYTPGSGFTIEERVPAAPNTKLIVEDQVQTIAGAVSASATFSASASWAAAVAAFKAAGGGGGSPPSITSLSLASGPVGTQVTITGTNFGASQGSSAVTFGGISAGTASNWSAASITVQVPANAISGSVVVTVGGVASNGANFTVNVPPPSITGLNPTSGLVSTPVMIAGTNFTSLQGAPGVSFNGVASAATSWTSTSIATFVPNGAATGPVVVTVGGVASNGVNFTVIPPPNITSVSPTSAPVGASVTITGTNFGASQGTSKVGFNGTLAVPTSWSNTSIQVTVPAGATTGNVVVSVSGVGSNGVNFAVLPSPPSITSLNPTSGGVLNFVTISGANFGSSRGSSTVTFNGIPDTPSFSSWNSVSITTMVPAGATTGPVVVTVGSQSSNAVPFTVTTPTPSITSLSPASGLIGALVTISGTNFAAIQGASTVTFNGIAAVPTSWGTTSITAPVPAGATTGNVVVTVGGVASNSLTFTVTGQGPSIANLSPTSGPAGSSITILGANFGPTQGTSTVTFAGVVAGTAISWSPGSIAVSVPPAATTGNVVVTVGGAASNGVFFTFGPDVTPPSPPTNLVATAASAGSVIVAWTGSTDNMTVFSYSVERCLGVACSTFAQVATVQAPTTSFVDAGLAGSTNYSYRVRAADAAGNLSSYSNIANATTQPAKIAVVQHASKDAGTTSSSSLAFGSNNIAGNFIAVAIRAGHSGQVFSITDTRGSMYRQAALLNQTLDTPNGDTLAIFYAENIAGGANTVTVSESISNNTMRFAILEYSGVATTSSLDLPATAVAQGTGISPGSGNVTPTVTGDLILGALMTGSGVTFTAGSGFTIGERVPAAPNSKLVTEDQVQGTVGAVAANATLSAGASWGAAVAAFKAAGGGGNSAPTITNLNPTSGAVGSPVTISGTNFGTGPGTSTVTFNGVSAPPTSWSATSISVPVPGSLATGSATVIVTVNNVSSNGATFTVTPPPAISVTVTPARGGVTVTQPLSLTAAVQNDSSNAGVSWSVSGGTLSGQTSSAATFSATGPGVYTITATSKADVTRSASAVIGVTDLSGVKTWRNDNSRSGVNFQEYALTPQNVTTSTFGKLFSCPVDGQVFAQPLWAANVSVGGAPHNVVFVATENDSLYAFDADGPGCNRVWTTSSVSLIPSGEVVVPFADLQSDNALGPVVGITGTPVIDPTSQTIYLVALTEVSGTSNVIQRLHAIDITTGRERTGSPQIISASTNNASGYDNSGGVITFAPSFQKQRPALLLLNGVIYISWAGFLDTDFYHGWVIGYDATTLAQVTVFNDTPDGGRGGIWMSGGGPAADAQGNIYLLTGNGDFNANSTGGRNYGDTFLKLGTSGGLSVADWFTPHDQSNMANNDLDLGGGGAVILFDQPGGPFPHLVLGGSKGGMLYVVSRDGLGHFNSTNDTQIVQSFVLGSNGIFSAPLFWQNTLYAAGSGSTLGAYPFSPATDQFQTSPSAVSSQIFSHPGTTPSLSANGTSNAILWAIRRPSATSAAVLHAFDPANIHTALWDSTQAMGNRDQAGVAVKFTVPTVANGKVYIGTMTELDVYGLLPN